jgi:hypothetical protein
MGATAVKTVEVVATEIPDLKMIVPRVQRDHRGFFSETYSKAGLSALGVNLEFVQDNHSLSVERGSARVAFPDSTIRAGQTRTSDPRIDLRRWGRYSPRVGDVREARGADDQRSRLEPVSGADRIRTWVLHAGAQYRGHLQSDELLLAGA